MKRNNSFVVVRLKGDLYSFNTKCHTLKEAMETYPSLNKRSNIAEWCRVAADI